MSDSDSKSSNGRESNEEERRSSQPQIPQIMRKKPTKKELIQKRSFYLTKDKEDEDTEEEEDVMTPTQTMVITGKKIEKSCNNIKFQFQ